MDFWKSENFELTHNSRILVIGKNPKYLVRKSFESTVASKLRAQKLDAVESFTLFPNLSPAKTGEEQKAIVQKFKSAGFGAIMVMTLKQSIVTQKEGFASNPGIPEEYQDRSNFENGLQDASNLEVSTSTTYVLETLVYNLELEKDDQLVNVSLVEVTDPKSEDNIRKALSKILANQFK